ncbi:type VI secretion system lipoprotein TssJ [Rubrivirga sp. IMCC45206]|uniref:type VI secretion system lipoprotein TssJ n=1 Tax=Rubrivirga sp. IMCC45206 TaxID=3391614 RepID=UPI00398FDE30
MTRLLTLSFALALTGCGLLGGGSAPDPVDATPEAPPAPTAPSSVSLVGQMEMNAGGNAARVYLYPLASDATFRSTPVQAFWEDPAGTLGADLVGSVRDATVRPGETTPLDGLDLGSAIYLGIAADLRVPDGDRWRAVLPVADVLGRDVVVTVLEGGVSAVTR